VLACIRLGEENKGEEEIGDESHTNFFIQVRFKVGRH
jgi:hypothetical protein